MEELQQLIKNCINHNRMAQEELYRKFYPALFLLCKRFFANEHEALECLNDGMLKVFKKLSGFRGGNGQFFNWMYTVVRNTALDKLKLKRIAFEPLNDDIMEPVCAVNPLEALENKDIYKLLEVLSPATRIVCCLYYIEGYTIKEISERLGLHEGTIKWHLSETRKKLKSVMKNHYSK